MICYLTSQQLVYKSHVKQGVQGSPSYQLKDSWFIFQNPAKDPILPQRVKLLASILTGLIVTFDGYFMSELLCGYLYKDMANLPKWMVNSSRAEPAYTPHQLPRSYVSHRMWLWLIVTLSNAG